MTTLTLKPCPHCNGQADIVKGLHRTGHPRWYKVYCARCQCRTAEHSRKKVAVKVWNQRTVSLEAQYKAAALLCCEIARTEKELNMLRKRVVEMGRQTPAASLGVSSLRLVYKAINARFELETLRSALINRLREEDNEV